MTNQSNTNFNDVAAIIRSFDPTSNSLKTNQLSSLINFSYDKFTYTDGTTTDTYKYYLNNVLVGTIVITYTNNNKTKLVSGERI